MLEKNTVDLQNEIGVLQKKLEESKYYEKIKDSEEWMKYLQKQCKDLLDKKRKLERENEMLDEENNAYIKKISRAINEYNRLQSEIPPRDVEYITYLKDKLKKIEKKYQDYISELKKVPDGRTPISVISDFEQPLERDLWEMRKQGAFLSITNKKSKKT